MRELGELRSVTSLLPKLSAATSLFGRSTWAFTLTALQAGILKSLKAGSHHAACEFIVDLLADAHATLQLIPARVAVQWFQQRFKLHESKDDTTIGCGLVQP